MSTIEEASAASAWGWSSGDWHHSASPGGMVDLVTVSDDPSQAWFQFDGYFNALISDSPIISATLKLNLPECPTKGITVYIENAQDAVAPIDGTDATSRSLGTYTTADISGSGVHSVDIDVTALIEQIRGYHDGDRIVLAIFQNEADINVVDVSATLFVEFVGAVTVEEDCFVDAEWHVADSAVSIEVDCGPVDVHWRVADSESLTDIIQEGSPVDVTWSVAAASVADTEVDGSPVDVTWSVAASDSLTDIIQEGSPVDVCWSVAASESLTDIIQSGSPVDVHWSVAPSVGTRSDPVRPFGRRVLPVANRLEAESGAALYLGPPGIDDPLRIVYRRFRPLGSLVSIGPWPDPDSPLLHDAARAIVQNPEDSIELDLSAEYLPAAGETAVFWAQVRTHSRGLENATLWRPVRIVIDDAGDIVGAIGGRAVITQVEKRDAGGVRIGWDWFPAAHGSQPVTFELRRTSGPTAVATVSTPVLGQAPHAVDIAGLQDEGEYTFALVAVADDAEEALATIEFTADSSGPPAAESLSIEAIQ